MDLHRASVPLDFSAMTPSRHLLSLPAYAWEKTRWWNEASDAREGRLGSGGRGLFDVRLPRAMPTWIVRLDSRHIAFLKDHKVENHVIFPAAAFVEMALEAGVQLFEGRPFVVEDFEIRKPLILPDPPSGVQLELLLLAQRTHLCDPESVRTQRHLVAARGRIAPGRADRIRLRVIEVGTGAGRSTDRG